MPELTASRPPHEVRCSPDAFSEQSDSENAVREMLSEDLLLHSYRDTDILKTALP
jgi:hypothetical protein